MSMTKAQATEVQARLVAKGYDLGKSGKNRDGVDGDYGTLTHGNLLACIASAPDRPKPQVATVGNIVFPNFTDAEARKLAGVHPHLVRVLSTARAMGARFRIDATVRTEAEQRRLVNSGASQTMDSRHLTGHAVDLYPLDDVDHDNQPWDWDDFYPLAEQLRAAAEAEGVPIRWGGCWQVVNGTTKSAKALVAEYSAARRAAGRKPFLDGPHFELPAAQYPKAA
jgi:peptidoglycan L-alanyl-D-glutamate endopeptidase CwlK